VSPVKQDNYIVNIEEDEKKVISEEVVDAKDRVKT
jgi:hypothetical protein